MRVLIVDDEPHARRRLRRLLEAHADVEIVGEAGDGNEAIARVRDLAPDVVFLDVQMPEIDGFGVLEALGDAMPAVVFVTAYDEYCLRAFDVHAIDYLLKPFEDERFAEALGRVRQTLRTARLDGHREALAALLRERHGGARRIAVKRGETIHFVDPAEIEWVSAEGNQVRLHLRDGREVTVRRTLKDLQAALPGSFLRVHRSSLIDVEQVKRLHSLFHGEFMVELMSGAQVRASRTYVDDLRKALGLERGRDT